jgi:hypothetical protein
MPGHVWVSLLDHGQGPRQICRECGISKNPITEGGVCGGAHQVRGRVVSDYDPFG